MVAKQKSAGPTPPPKVEDNTLDEQHAGIEPVQLPVTDNDEGPGEKSQSHVKGAGTDAKPSGAKPRR